MNTSDDESSDEYFPPTSMLIKTSFHSDLREGEGNGFRANASKFTVSCRRQYWPESSKGFVLSSPKDLGKCASAREVSVL